MIKNEIENLLSPIIQELGFELWGCEYLTQGRYSLLRIYIDKEKGIELEDCAIVSKRISAVLDVEDPIQGNYSLEVSSPGIPRPLFKWQQYKRYLQHSVMLKLISPYSGKRKHEGKILAVDENSVTLEVGNEELEIPFSLIVKANLIDE